ncbi:zinc finger protein 1 homolog [Stomoxys calcitrans]|uniref:Protein krueppel n=1 Tax=Stomoxys calcitrans TaxID=35570 RepID=A0A1I8Q9T3_STOCA|nr:zinc finger protein 1 homolog [Stomoxys calcitrans]
MEVFDNCRICLQAIPHEPIKMTRSILKFIEQGLQMPHITRKLDSTNVKQNLCAACFNKLAEFQDFHEVCKDADEFWKRTFPKEHDEGQHAVDTKKELQMEQNQIAVVDVTSTCTQEQEMQLEVYPESKSEEENDELLLSLPFTDQADQEVQSENEDKPDKIVDVNAGHVSVEWRTEDEESVIESENDGSGVEDQDIIEYEYVLPQENSSLRKEGIEDIVANDDEAHSQMENQPYVYEVGDDDSCTLVQDSYDDGMENATETSTLDTPMEVSASANTYIVKTVLDDNGKVKKSYQCQHCDRCFDRIYDIESHYNIHTDVKPYKCEICGKSFRQKNILTTHQAALHFGKKIECPECGKMFARRSQLILHFRMHRDEKPFVCEFVDCQAAFRQRQHLVDHLFIHTGEKNFQCSTCEKAFQTRKRLQDHIYKVHSYHRYGCDRCEKMFLKPHMLRNHLASAHKVAVKDVSHLKILVDPIRSFKKSDWKYNKN